MLQEQEKQVAEEMNEIEFRETIQLEMEQLALASSLSFEGNLEKRSPASHSIWQVTSVMSLTSFKFKFLLNLCCECLFVVNVECRNAGSKSPLECPRKRWCTPLCGIKRRVGPC